MSVTTNIQTFYSNVEVGDNIIVDTDTFYLNAGNARVGINTSSPDVLLHVVGDTAFDYTGATQYSSLLLNGGRDISFQTSSSLNRAIIGDLTSDVYNRLRINEKLYLNGSGSVGLGASPTSRLEIYPGSQITAHLGKLKMTTDTDHCRISLDDKDNTSSYALKISNDSAGDVTFNVPTGRNFYMWRGDNINLFYNGSNDYIGIGTNDPGHKFQVEGRGLALRRPAKVESFLKNSNTFYNNNAWADVQTITFTPLATGGRSSEVICYLSMFPYLGGAGTDEVYFRLLADGAAVSNFDQYFDPQTGGGSRKNGNFLMGGKTVVNTNNVVFKFQVNTVNTDDGIAIYQVRGYIVQYTIS